jgi:CubicO group peptidase (beta-lactamase class C family)
MDRLAESVGHVAAATGFSGVVRVDRSGESSFAVAHGLAHRGYGIANTIDTRFPIASGTKGVTSATVMTLVERGELALATTARSVLGEDLPLIDDEVTVEQLLSHRSGIGDYLDEDAIESPNEYVMPVPVHLLAGTEDYLRVLAGYQQAFPPDERFAYNNSGFVVLALIAERVSGVRFERLVRERVCEPAGMRDTAFVRSDEPLGRCALGYLDSDGYRTNALHLPVLGSGDGGLYSTAADISAFWSALFAGTIVTLDAVAEMRRPRGDGPSGSTGYGLGLWLDPGNSAVVLEGHDAGVSFRSRYDPETRLTCTVLANTTDGAWAIVDALDDVFGT